MTKQDTVKQEIEQSITSKVDIEELCKWAKEQYEDARSYTRVLTTFDAFVCDGEIKTYRKLIQKLNEMKGR